MKMHIYLLLFCSIFLFNCNTQKKKELPKIEIKSKFPVLIGLDKVKKISIFEGIREFGYPADFGFFYIGKYKDTITVNERFYIPQPPSPIEYEYLPKIKGKKRVKKIKKSIDPYRKYYDFDEKNIPTVLSIEAKIEILAKYTNGSSKYFPIYLKNLEKKNVGIGTHGMIKPMVIEAKDSLGQWKPLQRIFIQCSQGANPIFLPPNEIIITMAAKYYGDYKTILRVRFGNNLSEPFAGKINYNQLLEPTDYF